MMPACDSGVCACACVCICVFVKNMYVRSIDFIDYLLQASTQAILISIIWSTL